MGESLFHPSAEKVFCASESRDGNNKRLTNLVIKKEETTWPKTLPQSQKATDKLGEIAAVKGYSP